MIFYTHHLVGGLGHPLRIDQEPPARSISLFPSCAPTPVMIKVGTAEWLIARLQLGGVRRAVSKLAAESAAPLPVGS